MIPRHKLMICGDDTCLFNLNGAFYVFRCFKFVPHIVFLESRPNLLITNVHDRHRFVS